MESIKSVAAKLLVGTKSTETVASHVNSGNKIGIIKQAASLIREKINGCCNK